MKLLLHTLQTCLFSPVCVASWSLRLRFLVNSFPHSLHRCLSSGESIMQYYTALLNSKELFYNDNSGTDTAQIKAINSTYKDQIMVIKPLQISHTTTHCPRRRLRDLSTVNLHRANSLFKNSTTETYRNFLKVTTCYSIFRCHYRRHGAAKVLTSFYSKAEMNGITLCYSCGGAFCVKASVGVTPSPTDKYQDLLT